MNGIKVYYDLYIDLDHKVYYYQWVLFTYHFTRDPHFTKYLSFPKGDTESSRKVILLHKWTLTFSLLIHKLSARTTREVGMGTLGNWAVGNYCHICTIYFQFFSAQHRMDTSKYSNYARAKPERKKRSNKKGRPLSDILKGQIESNQHPTKCSM